MSCDPQTRINGEFLPQVAVGLFGHLVSRAVFDLVLIQEAADLLRLLLQPVVVFIHQTLNPAARGAFRALREDREKHGVRSSRKEKVSVTRR